MSNKSLPEIENCILNLMDEYKKASSFKKADHIINSINLCIDDGRKLIIDKQQCSEFIELISQFRNLVRKSQVRYLKLLNPDITYVQIDQILGSGLFQAFIEEVAVDNIENLDKTIEEINTRHLRIIHLERTVKELHILAGDLALLTSDQQTTIDKIETHIERTNQLTEEATKELKKGENEDKKGRKWKIALAVLLVSFGVSAKWMFKND